MRRFANSLIAIAALTVISGCASGYGLNTNSGSSKITKLVLSNANGTGTYYIAPTGTSPLLVSASAQTNNGVYVTSDVPITWSAVIATSPTTYTSSITGAATACTLYKESPVPAVPLYVQSPGSPLGLAPLDGANSQTVGVLPVSGVTPPYCITITASDGSGHYGTVTAVVTN
jgi:hypothetical protein